MRVPCRSIGASIAVVSVFAFGAGGSSASARVVEPIEVESFHVETLGPAGSLAGAHADVTGAIAFAPSPETKVSPFSPKGDVRDASIDLPVGLVGNPTAVPTCSEAQLDALQCPVASQVGTVDVYSLPGLQGGDLIPLYDVTPSEGEPAAFGFVLEGEVNLAVASAIPSATAPGGYTLQLTFSEVSSQVVGVLGTRLTMWAVPADPSHDPERVKYELMPGGMTPTAVYGQPSGEPLRPFLRLPTSCGSPLTFTATVDSWEMPGVLVPAPVSNSEGVITGCEGLGFEPSLAIKPGSDRADTPVGYTVELQVPQSENPEGRGTPDLRDATVTLPQGVSLSPSTAEGLGTCSAAQFGIGDVEKHGLRESVAAGGCPEDSKVARVEIESPLLPKPLEGRVYAATPGCDPCSAADVQAGRMIGLYLEARETQERLTPGVIVKVKGTVSSDPATGRLTAHFDELPQLPFSRMRMIFNPDGRAPLTNPQTCGPAVTGAELKPWSYPGTAIADPTVQPFEVEGCPPGGPPFAPSFVAGTQSSDAGAFSPLTVAFARNDGEQDLSRIQVQTPPGLLGMLSSVSLCGEPQAGDGECSESSLIGTVTVRVGAGSEPLTLTGKVYLTGSYEGQPYGLSIVVPTTAGPFTLAGDTGRGLEVVRAAISVDPLNAALTVTSGAIPPLVDGIPVRERSITVNVNRPDFIFNPTGCDQRQITATITSGQGAIDHAASPFTAGGCRGLAFTPRLSVSTSGKPSRANGTSVTFKITYPPGSVGNQSWFRTAKFDLPKQLPARLETLKQACPAARFAANPASCPPASRIGVASVSTPVLPVKLSGPVFFVSNGGAKFPEAVIVLQGYGVTVQLHGETFIDEKTGITSATFSSLPDVPFNEVTVNLPAGPFSEFAGIGNLCAPTKTITVKKKIMVRSKSHTRTVKRNVTKTVPSALEMPVAFTAQNGLLIKQATKLTVTGCPTVKHKTHKSKKANASNHNHAMSDRKANR